MIKYFEITVLAAKRIIWTWSKGKAKKRASWQKCFLAYFLFHLKINKSKMIAQLLQEGQAESVQWLESYLRRKIWCGWSCGCRNVHMYIMRARTQHTHIRRISVSDEFTLQVLVFLCMLIKHHISAVVPPPEQKSQNCTWG